MAANLMTEIIRMTSINDNFSHLRWVKEIGKIIGEDDTRNIIIFCLSYTLQSLREEEDFNRFKWKEV